MWGDAELSAKVLLEEFKALSILTLQA